MKVVVLLRARSSEETSFWVSHLLHWLKKAGSSEGKFLHSLWVSDMLHTHSASVPSPMPFPPFSGKALPLSIRWPSTFCPGLCLYAFSVRSSCNKGVFCSPLRVFLIQHWWFSEVQGSLRASRSWQTGPSSAPLVTRSIWVSIEQNTRSRVHGAFTARPMACPNLRLFRWFSHQLFTPLFPILFESFRVHFECGFFPELFSHSTNYRNST